MTSIAPNKIPMEYIFESAQERAEFERLKQLEEAFDDQTKALIQTSGIAPGWKCLELGPGAGSILKWMSDLVGNAGKVIGVDKNTQYLQGIEAKQVECLEEDIFDVELEKNSFDLIHARYVLVHIAKSQELIKALIELLKTGGVIILEEPDFTAAQVINNNLPNEQAHQRVNEAIRTMFFNLGLDPSFGIKLPSILQSNGIKIEKVIADRHLCSGQSKIAKMMGTSAKTLKDKYINTQKASELDVAHYIENSENEWFWAVYYSTISVVGIK